jgi:serine/threonine-protein kinase
VARTARDSYAQTLEFLDSEIPERCFVALPSLLSEARMALEVFGPNTARLAEFSTSMQAELGAVSGATERVVTRAQCRALEFVRNLPSYPGFRSYIQLEERVIATNTPLRGRILGTGGRHVHLVIIDNQGRVQTLDPFLLLGGGGARFAVPMRLTVSEVTTWQLLMAISTEEPVQRILRMTQPQSAERFFANLDADLRRSRARADVALMAFSVR